MSLRNNARQKGDNDYSNLGVSGRRTGLVLPQGRLDNNGIEEITGIFSSPRKSSPLKKVSSVHSADEGEEGENVTPKQTRSSRRSRPARSASPRKSGIGGTARRSNAVDILRHNPSKGNQDLGRRLRSKSPTPIARFDARSESPLPRRERATSISHRAEAKTASLSSAALEPNLASAHHRSIEASRPRTHEEDAGKGRSLQRNTRTESPRDQSPAVEPVIDFDSVAPMYDSDDSQPVQPIKRSSQRVREPMTANSTRKRRSDAVDTDYEPDVQSSPAAKRAKRIGDDNVQRNAQGEDLNREATTGHDSTDESEQPRSKTKQRNTSSTMSTQQQGELDKMVEKIRSRPGQKKSLYVLRREKRDDHAVQTRSGRVSVKPLAYWRNERCVFGGSPGGATLADGARFPLNSIKEIIRTEEHEEKKSRKGRKPSQHKGAAKKTGQSANAVDSSDEEYEDPDAEAWETESGTVRGTVQVWDPEYQVAIDEEEDVDIAYSAGAIQTKDVAGAEFKYAKTLSTRFLGCGLVELPGGTVKKPKNSRKMQMSFFVAKGRVTVSVGPESQAPTTFSIGKGGFWQVPRGNQYSIENEHEKTAMIFFSQGCELVVAPEDS